MTCSNCGGATEMTESEGGVREGKFSETYRCVNCGAWGTIRGEAAAPPQEWERVGEVFGR